MRQLSWMVAFLAAALCGLTVARGEPARWHVSPDGDDAWTGAPEAPNADRSDGPFATLGRARDAIRALKAGGHLPAGGAVVWVHGGRYFLPETLTLTPDDSGDEGAPVVYAAWKDQEPTLSGGARVTGWEPDGDGRWRATLPDAAGGRWAFNQLFVNGRRRFRPRWPKAGYAYIAGEVSPTPANAAKGYDRFRFKPGDLRAGWKNRGQIEVLTFHHWFMSRLPIADVDERSRVVTLAGSTRTTAPYGALSQGWRYLVENVADELKDPGEWYLDRADGRLTYLPLPGEKPDRADVVAPRLAVMLSLQGDADKQRWVRHVTFRGLTFEHANWTLPPDGYSSPQAEVPVGGAISAEGARMCWFDRCAVKHVGTYALSLGAGCKGNVIEGCEFTDLGAGGVKIGETRLRGDDQAVASHNTLRNCLIAGGGRVHPAAVGVWVGHAHHNTIEHNDVYDLYYTGISAGWVWGYRPSGAHHNLIADNHIHDIGQGVLSDMGGIYTLGVSPGTVLRGNLIHDVESFTYGGWGIYPDEGTSNLRAENNVVYNTKTGGFHQHYGQENEIVNNVFAFGKEHQLERTRPETHTSFTFERNLVYWNGPAPLLHGNWSPAYATEMDHNLYWNGGAAPVTFAGQGLGDWQRSGRDGHSLVADPQFVNPQSPQSDGFALKPGSPAEKVGFVPIDVTRAGRTAGRPAAPFPGAYPTHPRAAPPLPIFDDFEETPAGRPPAGPTVNEDKGVKKAVVRVTDEAAAGGKHSLKFTDAPGQKSAFNPHVYYQPKYASGVAVARFALRMEPGGHCEHEWRTAGHPYHVGPSIRLAPDGSLRAGGQKLMDVPAGKWVKFEVAAPLGPSATGKWDLSVTLPGETEPKRFAGLPCDAQFKSLDWLGFVAQGDADGVFYLDDLEVTPR